MQLSLFLVIVDVVVVVTLCREIEGFGGRYVRSRSDGRQSAPEKKTEKTDRKKKETKTEERNEHNSTNQTYFVPNTSKDGTGRAAAHKQKAKKKRRGNFAGYVVEVHSKLPQILMMCSRRRRMLCFVTILSRML